VSLEDEERQNEGLIHRLSKWIGDAVSGQRGAVIAVGKKRSRGPGHIGRPRTAAVEREGAWRNILIQGEVANRNAAGQKLRIAAENKMQDLCGLIVKRGRFNARRRRMGLGGDG